MQIENLEESDVHALEEKLDALREENPEITHRVFDMESLKENLEKGKAENEMLQEISDKLDSLALKLERIFGPHVLLNGVFADLTITGKQEPD